MKTSAFYKLKKYYKIFTKKYSNEIRSAVLMVHGEKTHSCYFSKNAYNNMVKDSKYEDNKELIIIPDAVHTDLYDNLNVNPFDKIVNSDFYTPWMSKIQKNCKTLFKKNILCYNIKS